MKNTCTNFTHSTSLRLCRHPRSANRTLIVITNVTNTYGSGCTPSQSVHVEEANLHAPPRLTFASHQCLCSTYTYPGGGASFPPQFSLGCSVQCQQRSSRRC